MMVFLIGCHVTDAQYRRGQKLILCSKTHVYSAPQGARGDRATVKKTLTAGLCLCKFLCVLGVPAFNQYAILFNLPRRPFDSLIDR